ncbi:MAG: hypothetical protein M1837_007212 [Sclerophora amabilis]|nr:MAG: hypothetical protein M1837_007212 [Sclerophora amabilis]
MGPYRPNGQPRRSGRAQIDHDLFEGLPVRHWRRQTLTVAAPVKVEINHARNFPSELPMPKDSHMLCPMSRALLQAARAGRINKPAPPSEEEVKLNAEEEHAKKDEAERAFLAKRWQVVPRHMESPEVSYLAKRRKGLQEYPRNGALGPTPGGGVVKRTTVRKVDLEGNSLVEEMLVAEGQTVDGEVLSEVTMTDAGAPGTIVDGVGVVNADGVVIASDGLLPTPTRRRAPPPRRKTKSSHKSRRKKVQYRPKPGGPNRPTAEGNVNPVQDWVQIEGEVRAADGQDRMEEGADVEMGDDSVLRDGEEDEDDGDEGEEGEEGDEEGDDDDREDGELSPWPDANNSVSPSKAPVPESLSNILQPPSEESSHPLPPKPEVTVPVVETPFDSTEETITTAQIPEGTDSVIKISIESPDKRAASEQMPDTTDLAIETRIESFDKITETEQMAEMAMPMVETANDLPDETIEISRVADGTSPTVETAIELPGRVIYTDQMRVPSPPAEITAPVGKLTEDALAQHDEPANDGVEATTTPIPEGLLPPPPTNTLDELPVSSTQSSPLTTPKDSPTELLMDSMNASDAEASPEKAHETSKEIVGPEPGSNPELDTQLTSPTNKEDPNSLKEHPDGRAQPNLEAEKDASVTEDSQMEEIAPE